MQLLNAPFSYVEDNLPEYDESELFDFKEKCNLIENHHITYLY